MTAPRFLLLPGWRDSGPTHWQSRWEALQGDERVQQDDWWWPRRGDWMARLDEGLLADERPAVLIAHSLGCQLVAAWATHSRHTARVLGALLVALPDIARADMPPQLQAWAPIPLQPLPFASTAVLSSDDPYCSAARGRQMASAWGSEIVDAGAAGHLNSASGLGDWPAGQALLRALLQRSGAAAAAWPPAPAPN
ncbi:MAG: alpha/beta hydrolase [Burkholderiales bacterium PBB5]|nr:MAG: alpha/beta hydrolase [Burkholderiales bacterium PBB5]